MKKQKIVIKVCASDKCRSKAMGLVASVKGVESVAIHGDYGDQLAVVGEGVDSVALTCLLRRKIGNAQLLTVEDVKPPPPPPPPTTTTKKKKTCTDDVSPCQQQTPQWIPGYGYPWPGPVYGLPPPWSW